MDEIPIRLANLPVAAQPNQPAREKFTRTGKVFRFGAIIHAVAKHTTAPVMPE
jgi:hypothetical protein